MKPACAAGERETTTRFSPRAQMVLAGCACAGSSVFLFEIDPHRHAVYPQCLLYQTTGFYCPGCGATRAAYALLHGRILEALHDNLLFTSLLPFALGGLALYLGRAWARDAWPSVRMDQNIALWRGSAFLALLIFFMVARNLPGAPFSWLRPV